MKRVLSKDETKAVLIALDQNDVEVLELLFHSHIVFGMYSLWLNNPEGRGRDDAAVKAFLQAYPDAKGMAFISNSEKLTSETSYIPKEKRREISKQDETMTLFQDL